MIQRNGFCTLELDEFLDAKKNAIAIIDVRRQDEYDYYGVIPGSYKLPFFDRFGDYNIEQWMEEFQKIVTSKDQPFVLVCAHANRTKAIGQLLGEQLGYTQVYELDGGINYGWIDKGYQTAQE
ncbi:MAG: rhodanese-like domain-containing protein [Campylobacterales bacterium]|nr:rhodanese-like domain-containing protein [Campylobacterales bacterium]